MRQLLVCAALGIEARALADRSNGGSRPERAGRPGDAAGHRVERTGSPDSSPDGLAGYRVERIGMGPKRARRAATRLPEHDTLVVAGFGGAVDPDLRPGDVVVASEVRSGARTVACPGYTAVAELLERRGLPVVTGPLATLDHVGFRRALTRLADEGVAAVDMETFPLVEASEGRPFGAIRVIVDTPDHPLLRPTTMRAGLAARKRLREIGPVLREWASALEPV